MMNVEKFASTFFITIKDTLITFEITNGDIEIVRIPLPFQLPPGFPKETSKPEDRYISSITLSSDGKYIAVATENKLVFIYDQYYNLLKSIHLARNASKLTFVEAGGVLIADRTGDVYMYNLEDPEPVLVLGHLSVILDMVLSPCRKFLVTSDRDEKIRVSHFPNTHNIQSYCLGHEEFVTSLRFVGDILVSGSGDGTVRFWNFKAGSQIGILDPNNDVQNPSLLSEFSQEMDKEKVDVTALPVSQLEVLQRDSDILLAVSLYKTQSIQLYKICLEDISPVFLQKLDVNEAKFKFILAEKLYVFSKLGITTFVDQDGKYTQEKNEVFDAFYEIKEKCFQVEETNFNLLYKRQFDNVQEYLERKKARLVAKQ